MASPKDEDTPMTEADSTVPPTTQPTESTEPPAKRLKPSTPVPTTTTTDSKPAEAAESQPAGPYVTPYGEPNILPEKLDDPAKELYRLLQHIPGALNPPPPGGDWDDQPKPQVITLEPADTYHPPPGELYPPAYETKDLLSKPKPWKNPNWKPKKERVKTLKQILADEARAEAEAAAARAEKGEPEPEFEWDEKTKEAYKKLGLTLPKRYPNWNDLEAGPSLHPERAGKWCDITGLPAKYTDPKTGLRYYNSEVYQYIKTLSAEQIEGYLALRGANVVLK